MAHRKKLKILSKFKNRSSKANHSLQTLFPTKYECAFPELIHL